MPENRQNSDHMLMSQQHLLVLVSIGVIAQECWRTEVCMTLLYFCTSNLYLRVPLFADPDLLLCYDMFRHFRKPHASFNMLP